MVIAKVVGRRCRRRVRACAGQFMSFVVRPEITWELRQTEYQWSKGIADGSIGAGEGIAVENVSCRACDRSVSPFDVRHNLMTSAVYQLPFGTGRPFCTTAWPAGCSGAGT